MSAMGFPMLSGVDAASYAVNSGPQNSVLLRCRPALEKAIAMQQASLIEKKSTAASAQLLNDVFRIADMGCSSGPNCVANMQFMVDTIYKHNRLNYDLQGFFCDLPSNDFNTLFQLLHHGTAHHRSFFGAAAVAGTVYGRLFPVSSLHLVFSSCCLHWLSRVPELVSIPGTMEWNKGKIWVDGPLANEATGRAYANQWQQDINVFLEARSLELVRGGMMFLLIPCRPHSFLPHQMQNESCFRNLELSWQQLIQEGVLEQGDMDTFNVPKYLPTIEEIATATHSMSNLRIQSLDVLEEPIGDNYWQQWSHDPNEWAKRVDNFYRSAFWNVIEGHVGTLKCEAIFERFRKLLRESLQNQSSWDSYWAHPWSLYAMVHILKEI